MEACPFAVPGVQVRQLGQADPWNMQTRYLAPGALREDHHVLSGLQGMLPNATLASIRMKSLFFVGITDLYKESVCLFHFGATGAMPEACKCSSQGKELALHRETHLVPPHSINDLSLDEVLKVGRLVDRDVKLYLEALNLFETMIGKVEQATGVRVLCGGEVEALRNNVLSLAALAKPQPQGTNQRHRKLPRAAPAIFSAPEIGEPQPQVTTHRHRKLPRATPPIFSASEVNDL
mmetsp:Transcript_32271/g.91491  ORF Transcript_32271/g.91491 Transcript_32271/m.91491 type:complete len:235 (-) Transcript_32271:215-919(-)